MCTKILVTGANGQLGRCLYDIHKNFPETESTFMGREHLPLHDFDLVDRVVEALKPDVIINTAAYTAVDKAETESDEANRINGFAVGNLSAAAHRVGARFLHVSTDYVFNGKGTRPYLESDLTDPVNAYGKSKLLGEHLALQENSETVIVRTSWVYSEYGKNFVKTMLALMQDRPLLKVVNDQIGSPTSAHDLAEVLYTISISGHFVPGIYNYSNLAEISWFEFAKKINEVKGLYNCEIVPIPTKEFPTPAKRPYYSCLNCSKIREVYPIDLKPWEPSLVSVLNKL